MLFGFLSFTEILNSGKKFKTFDVIVKICV